MAFEPLTGTNRPRHSTRLIVRQNSAFSGFHYLVSDEAGVPSAELEWPFIGQARNDRLRWHGDDDRLGRVQIRIGASAWSIAYEHLTRGFVNDTRYLLMSPSEECCAMAELLHSPPVTRFRRGVMSLTTPVAGRLVRSGNWTRVRFDLVSGEHLIGRVSEAGWFSLKRELVADLPSAFSVVQRVFIVFLVLQLISAGA